MNEKLFDRYERLSAALSLSIEWSFPFQTPHLNVFVRLRSVKSQHHHSVDFGVDGNFSGFIFKLRTFLRLLQHDEFLKCEV